MHVHHPREKNNKRTLQETQREKKIVVCIRIARENRPGRNAHTKNKYTPVQRTKKVIKCESSVFLLFLLYIYTYIKKYKVIDVSDQILKIDSELNAKKRYMREIGLVHIHIIDFLRCLFVLDKFEEIRLLL